MNILVTYDVSTASEGGARRLRRVAKLCERYGQRVQNSVFECLLEPADYKLFQSQLKEIISESQDTVRIYHLRRNWRDSLVTLGYDNTLNFEGPLLM